MKKVLFVQSSLGLGGIETFFVRLVKGLNEKGVRPKFLFLYKEIIDSKLLEQLQQHADIYYWKDVLAFSSEFIGEKGKLMLPLSGKKLRALFSDCEAIHVSNALTYLCAQRLASCLPQKIKCIFGIYHTNELAWGGNKLPTYERYFRKNLFAAPPMFLFFNEYSRKKTALKNGAAEYISMLFPLGVDMPDERDIVPEAPEAALRLVSIGRLVEFKTYNLHMLDVAHELKRAGVLFNYHIFGTGPLRETMQSKISELGLEEEVFLEGNLEYSMLDAELSKYQLFIGTGTALLHAAANGLPCITAIENEKDSNSYGYFSDLPGFDYHEQDMNFKKHKFYDLICSYSRLDVGGRHDLSKKSRLKSRAFNMKSCTDNFIIAFEQAPPIRKTSTVFYLFMFRFVSCEIFAKVTSGERYSKKYEHIL